MKTIKVLALILVSFIVIIAIGTFLYDSQIESPQIRSIRAHVGKPASELIGAVGEPFERLDARRAKELLDSDYSPDRCKGAMLYQTARKMIVVCTDQRHVVTGVFVRGT